VINVVVYRFRADTGVCPYGSKFPGVGVTPCGYPRGYMHGDSHFRADTVVCPYDLICHQTPRRLLTCMVGLDFRARAADVDPIGPSSFVRPELKERQNSVLRGVESNRFGCMKPVHVRRMVYNQTLVGSID